MEILLLVFLIMIMSIITYKVMNLKPLNSNFIKDKKESNQKKEENNMEILKIVNLSKTFISNKTPVTVLDNISLDINHKDIYGIIGLSGEGKSTLVRCLNALEKPTNGKIFYYGDETYEVASLDDKTLRKYRKDVSMIFQDFNLLNQKTVFENVEFPLTLTKGYRRNAESKKRIKELLELVGLKDKEKSYPSQLSGGQKQRVAIARSLINNPKILLCDECTSALDPTTASQILDLLKTLNKELGITIIIIAHQMSVIERVCNKVAILSEHKIVECGSTEEVFLNPKTEACKNLVYSEHVVTKLHDSKLIKLEFNGDTDSPLLANIVQECSIVLSVVYANSWVVDDKIFGQLIVKVPYYEKDIDKLKTYLNIKGIKYQEVNQDEFRQSTISS